MTKVELKTISEEAELKFIEAGIALERAEAIWRATRRLFMNARRNYLASSDDPDEV